MYAEISVAGRVLRRSAASAPHAAAALAWDGTDAYGRHVAGPARVSVRVGYEYAGTYRRPANSILAFGQSPTDTTLVTASRARASVTLWSNTTEWVDASDPRREGLGGWVPVGLDRLDPDSHSVTTSDGWIGGSSCVRGYARCDPSAIGARGRGGLVSYTRGDRAALRAGRPRGGAGS